jgi:hypothetical protein
MSQGEAGTLGTSQTERNYIYHRWGRLVRGNNISIHQQKKQSCIAALVALQVQFADCGANVKWPMIS